jgi:hypothetical protein
LNQIRPPVGSCRPAISRSSVLLPQPGRAEQEEQLAGVDREVDVGQGHGLAERLGDVGEADRSHYGAGL